MIINVINTKREIEKYIELVKKGTDPEKCWEETVVNAYWNQLCCYAPFDLSERKPKVITDLETLEKQYELLKLLDTNKLEKEFQRVTSILPNYDDDSLTVVIMPYSNDDKTVNEKQNGVVGTSLFGNMMIQINPLVEGYEAWINYVFAHEYHHTVWGNYWFMIHAGELENKFIDSLVIDGEADSFACELYPQLRPTWLFGMQKEQIDKLWEKTYHEIVLNTDVDYVSYMFGNEEKEIPWCAGYATGFMLVQKYLRLTGKTVVEILEIKPEIMLKEIEKKLYRY